MSATIIECAVLQLLLLQASIRGDFCKINLIAFGNSKTIFSEQLFVPSVMFLLF